MTSHKLAKLLLENPDQPVIIHTMNGFEYVEKIEVETETKELIMNDDRSKDIYFFASTHNENPAVILISASFGVS